MLVRAASVRGAAQMNLHAQEQQQRSAPQPRPRPPGSAPEPAAAPGPGDEKAELKARRLSKNAEFLAAMHTAGSTRQLRDETDVNFFGVFVKETESLDFLGEFLSQSDTIEHLFQVIPIFLPPTRPPKRKRAVEELTSQERELYRRVFDEFDVDGNGTIELDELRSALHHLHINVTEKHVEHMMNEVDTDNSMSIDFEEFLASIVSGHNDMVLKSAIDAEKAHKMGLHKQQYFDEAIARVVNFFEELPDRWPETADRLYRASLRATELVQHPMFDTLIIACIVLVGIAVGAELEFVDEDRDSAAQRRLAQFCGVTQTVTLVVFVLEVVLKILACGLHPMDYFRDKEDGAFNTFDFIVVALSVLFEIGVGSDASIIAVARLLRLLKIMAKVPALRIILSGLTAGIHSVKSILMLLMLIIFLSSILCVVIFGDNAPFHFGNVQQSMVTLVQVSTLSGWHEVFQVAYFGCADYDMDLYRGASERVKVQTDFGWFWGFECHASKPQKVLSILFFSVFTLFTAMVVLSLFISVVTMSMFEVRVAIPQAVVPSSTLNPRVCIPLGDRDEEDGAGETQKDQQGAHSREAATDLGRARRPGHGPRFGRGARLRLRLGSIERRARTP